MSLLDYSPEALDAAIRQFEIQGMLEPAARQYKVEAERLFESGEARAYVLVIAKQLRDAKGGPEQAIVLFSMIHLFISAGMYLARTREEKSAGAENE